MELKIKISTGKQRFRLKRDNDILLIDIKSNPQKGKANLEIIKELKKLFKKEARIVNGIKNKEKIIEIKNLKKSELEKVLIEQN